MRISRKNVICIASAAIIFILALIFDSQIVSFFTSIRVPFIVDLMKFISFFGSWYILPFIALIVMIVSKKDKRYKWMMASMISLLLGIIYTYILKIIIARPRPLESIMNLASWDSSFPSSHAAAVFAILPLLDKKIQPYWLAFAILMAISRLYLGVHYASDVIAGIAIGYASGLISLKILNLKKSK